MPTEFIVCPYQQITIGERVVNAPRVHIHRTAGEKYAAQRAQPAKAWAIVGLVDPAPATLANIDADGLCYRLPFNSSQLDAEWQSLAAEVQTAILTALNNRRIPTDWIAPETTLRQIVRFVLRLMNLCQGAGADFPEVDLAQTWGSVNNQQRTRFRNALVALAQRNNRTVNFAALGITNGMAIGECLRRVVNALDIPIRIADLEL